MRKNIFIPSKGSVPFSIESSFFPQILKMRMPGTVVTGWKLFHIFPPFLTREKSRNYLTINYIFRVHLSNFLNWFMMGLW